MPGVLIAGNEIFERLLIRETLSILPTLSFIEAEDGVTAVEQARRYRPKLVILDIRMPKMDGLEVCRVLKSDPAFSGLSVIVVTALLDPAHRVTARQVGVDGFVEKPFDETVLVRMVMHALQSRV